MPMMIDWDNAEKTVILITITPPITWQMFDEGVDESMKLAATVSHRVDIICNPGSTQLPPGMPLPHFKRAFEQFPTNVELLVSIITNLFARTMSSVAGQAFLGRRFRITGTLDDARSLIDRLQAETANEQVLRG